MNIESNKVTWFSKLLASGLLMFGLLIAFLAGMGYQNTVNQTYLPINIDSSKKIFRSEKYGFQLVYPADYLLFIDPMAANIPVNYISMCGGDQALCIVYRGPESTKPNFSSAGLMIYTITKYNSFDTEDKCIFFTDSQEENINGQAFYWRKGRSMVDGGLFDNDAEYLYRTFHNNKCYEILFGVESFGTGIAKDDKEKIISSLQKIVKTFRFVN